MPSEETKAKWKKIGEYIILFGLVVMATGMFIFHNSGITWFGFITMLVGGIVYFTN